jgi:hypothetical protein
VFQFVSCALKLSTKVADVKIRTVLVGSHPKEHCEGVSYEFSAMCA